MQAMSKQQGAGANSGKARPTTDRSPTLPGIARGTMGATGSRLFAPRNPDAGVTKERQQLLDSPIMQAFMRRRKKRFI